MKGQRRKGHEEKMEAVLPRRQNEDRRSVLFDGSADGSDGGGFIGGSWFGNEVFDVVEERLGEKEVDASAKGRRVEAGRGEEMAYSVADG